MAGQLTIDTLKASTGVLATQNGMNGIAKAWVSWNSTPTIFEAFNVSSITKNGTGDYTLNFTTALANTTYSPVFGTLQYSSDATNTVGMIKSDGSNAGPLTMTTTQLRVAIGVTSALGNRDIARQSVAILGS